MKISRRIVISILAYVLTTAVGFLGTLYFANVLGPGPLGTFALGMTLIKWLELTDFGTGGAMAKRISEMEEEGSYLTASIIIRVGIVSIPTIALLLFRGRVNKYIGGNFAEFVTLMFVLTSVSVFTSRVLFGVKKPHVGQAIDSLERILRVIFQAMLVLAGLSALAMYQGYIVSVFASTLVAGFFIYRSGIRPAMPEKRHFWSLYNYAKFNVLTRIRNRSFSWFDVLFLGFFVTNDAIGIYQVTWNVALTFWLVSNAISSNLFPEISHLSIRDRNEQVRGLLEEGLVYAGLIPLPGLVGATLVGRDVLRLYGPEFVVAADLIVVVCLLSLVKSYEQQTLTALNSLDHPEFAFRVNIAFVVINVVLNLSLIPPFELMGAAVATTVAVAVSLGYGWYYLRSLVDIRFPREEIQRQIVAALIMGGVVIGLQSLVDTAKLIPLMAVVTIGAAVYFSVLFGISRKFRTLTLDLWSDVPLGR